MTVISMCDDSSNAFGPKILIFVPEIMSRESKVKILIDNKYIVNIWQNSMMYTHIIGRLKKDRNIGRFKDNILITNDNVKIITK